MTRVRSRTAQRGAGRAAALQPSGMQEVPAGGGRHSGRLAKTLRVSWPAYLLFLPFLVHFFVVVAYPFFYSIYLSFTTAGLNETPQFVGVQNYTQLFADADFHAALGNTFYYTVFAVIGENVFALGLAMLLNNRLPGRLIFRTAYFLPVVSSWVIVSLMWSIIFNQQGIANQVLGMIGLPAQPFFASGTQAMWVIIAAGIWKDTGYYMIIYLAALQGVPQDLVEAAAIDGAGRWGTTWHVTLPHVRPVIYFVVSITVIYSMQLFTQPFIMTQGGPLNATLSLVLEIYQEAFQRLHFGYGSAIATVLLVILIILSLINRQINNRITR